MPLFSKKHYERLAEVLQESKPTRGETERMIQWENMVLYFAEHFEKDNPKFNKEQFLEACGYTK